MSEQQHSTARSTQQQAQAQARGGVGDGLQVRSGLAVACPHRRRRRRTGQVRSGQARSGRRAGVIVGGGGCWCGMDGYAGRVQARLAGAGSSADRQASTQHTHTHRAEWLFGGYLRYSLSKID